MSEIQLYGPPKVGGDVLAYCNKCKVELAHVVFSMVENKPAKVVCKTCKGNHKYKLIGDTVARKPRAPRATGPKKAFVSAEQYWDEKMAKLKGKTQRPYSPKESFKKDEVINHSVFGVGIIEEVKQGGKVVVLFRGVEKVLIHTAAAPAT